MNLYTINALKCSKIITNNYSTSFSLGIRFLGKKYRKAIYAIYGFVRFADEIVDSFFDYNQKELHEKFKKDTYDAIKNKISTNPILHSFQWVVNTYNIDKKLIDSFLYSMEMDLYTKNYSKDEYNTYIYGSAEVVGLMCLQVYYFNNREKYNELKYYSRKLGRAFQQINFLRDVKDDYISRGRIYFPGIDFQNLTSKKKKEIENNIEDNLNEALRGIINLKRGVRFGVFLAYIYFKKLLKKIKKVHPKKIFEIRIRINNFYKIGLLMWSVFAFHFNKFVKLKLLNLKVSVDENSGFCFGVIKAIEKAEEHLENYNELYCLGEIVHNDEEIKRLERKGLKTIEKKDISNISNSSILFRAHGEPPISYKLVESNNNITIDASCPIILKLQEKIKNSFEQNEKILIYGKNNHPEVIGLKGQINNSAIVFERIEDIDLKNLPKKFTLYSQTTMDESEYLNIYESLKKKGFIVKLNNSVCKQVSNRKNALYDFATQYDKVIFIAGKNSSNGKVLYDICKESNTNSYFVSNLGMIKPNMFKNNESVGICGATSTPKWLMEEAYYLIKSY